MLFSPVVFLFVNEPMLEQDLRQIVVDHLHVPVSENGLDLLCVLLHRDPEQIVSEGFIVAKTGRPAQLDLNLLFRHFKELKIVYIFSSE